MKRLSLGLRLVILSIIFLMAGCGGGSSDGDHSSGRYTLQFSFQNTSDEGLIFIGQDLVSEKVTGYVSVPAHSSNALTTSGGYTTTPKTNIRVVVHKADGTEIERREVSAVNVADERLATSMSFAPQPHCM